MQELKLRTKVLTLYGHIDEMPIGLYNNSNEYSLLDAEIGNSMQDINRHFQKMDHFISKKDWDGLIAERSNLHRNFFHIINKDNFRGLQFACHIKEVEGKPIWDYSHESLKKLLDELSRDGLVLGVVNRTIVDTKKKFYQSFVTHFRKGLATLKTLTTGRR